LLAVNARQLSPSVVAVKISEQGDFGVSELFLQKTSRNKTKQGAYRPTWFPNVHSTLQANMQTIAHNPLYSNNCSTPAGCPDRHWACPFVLSALFGGSARARTAHQNIQLITPGKHITYPITPPPPPKKKVYVCKANTGHEARRGLSLWVWVWVSVWVRSLVYETRSTSLEPYPFDQQSHRPTALYTLLSN